MEISAKVNSLFSSVSYLLDGHTLVDAGDYLSAYDTVSSVLLTHCHYDHIYGLNNLIESNQHIKIFTNESGREMLLNCRKNLSFYHESPFVLSDPSRIVTVKDGDGIDIGNGETAEAIFTPGHNPSCITWLVGDSIFTGDSYIPGIRTVTNLPGGNRLQTLESLELIKKLSTGHNVYPGHLLG